jgi:quercetin dioxygenase-like cupin family protein
MIMKNIHYTTVAPTQFDNEAAKGVAGRVAIGKADGAANFCMRIFELAPGGHTPKHTHAWEHEIFFHEGEGEAYGNGRWQKVTPGTALFVAPDEEHQIRNTGAGLLVFACLIPRNAPEL